MEEKKKVFIRGCKGRGSEVIDILTRLGANDIGESCDDVECIYYISHENQIVGSFIDEELAQVIIDNYKEIKLTSRKWKDGDILVDDKHPNCRVVFKKYNDHKTFEAYFILYDKAAYFDVLAHVEDYRLANTKEIEGLPLLFTFLMGALNVAGLCLPKAVKKQKK